MPHLTPTSTIPHFTHHPPSSSSATFNFPSNTPHAKKGLVTITLPPNSTFKTGLYWHSTHTEYIHVRHGTVLVRLNDTIAIITSAHGSVTNPRNARYKWMRWDHPHIMGSEKGAQEAWIGRMRGEGKESEVGGLGEGEMVVEEWTDPKDGHKEGFFRNLFGAVGERGYGE